MGRIGSLVLGAVLSFPRTNSPAEIEVDPVLLFDNHAVEISSLADGRSVTIRGTGPHVTSFRAGRVFAVARNEQGSLVGVVLTRDAHAGERARFETYDRPKPGRGHVLIRAEYSKEIDLTGLRDLRITLEGSRETLRADAAIDSAGRSAAALFGNVAAGRYWVRIETQYWLVDETTIEIGPTRPLGEAVLRLRPKPSISVVLELDASLAHEKRSLLLHRCPGWDGDRATIPELDACQTTKKEFSGDMAGFRWLAPEIYGLEAETGGRERLETVDLRNGQDASVTFRFHKVRLHGLVTEKGDGVPAELTFRSNEEKEEGYVLAVRAVIRSEPDGRYEANLWPDGYTVSVAPPEMEGRASTFHVNLEEGTEQRKDFVLSANTVRITLTDGATGQPIPHGKVLFIDSAGARAPVADDSGEVRLTAIHSGRLHATALAKGYVKSTADFEVADSEGVQSFEFRLSSETSGHDFRVVLPDGAPAAGVEAYYRYDIESEMRLRIPCDEEGVCHPPGPLADSEVLYFSHSDAGLTILRARQIFDSRVAVLRPSGGPLEIRLELGVESRKDDVAFCAIVSLEGVSIGPNPSFGGAEATAYGQRPEPLRFRGLPAGPVTFVIHSVSFDDQMRRISQKLAGPITVALPCAPVTVRLP